MNEFAQVKERPIIFSGPMVRAILDGRKTQTRRIVKRTPNKPVPHTIKCPYGIPGDRLWVRETFCHKYDCEKDTWSYDEFWYKADNPEVGAVDDDGMDKYNKNGAPSSPWMASIHMPRNASRINLEVTRVRVERLQDISEEDAKAEGGYVPQFDENKIYHRSPIFHQEIFKTLWNSINGPDAWEKNPWCWVVEFKRVENGQA